MKTMYLSPKFSKLTEVKVKKHYFKNEWILVAAEETEHPEYPLHSVQLKVS
jgi:hypothetical protein